MTDVDLNQLAARALNGDGAALSALCQQLESPVFRLCLRMLGEVSDAEDAAQDVMVKVLTNLSQFRGQSALLTWVHQVTVRHVLATKKSKPETRSLDEDAFAGLLEQGLAYGATQPPLTPEDKALLTEVCLSCTQGMLMILGRDERLALVLVELLGFDAAEAADIAEVSHEAMRQRLSRARGRLGTFLQSKCGVVNPAATCRCEKQLPAKKALGLTVERQCLLPLATGHLSAREDTSLAVTELRAVRAIAAAFHRNGQWSAPQSLRRRMQEMLPTVLGA